MSLGTHMMEGGVVTPILSLSTEQERDQYKEKVEHFKILIRKLQEENQSIKVRREGAETVSKLLQESKQECAALKRKQVTYESVIRNLQSRLEANGLSSDIVLQEGETYIPGQSKRLLDNLTRENNRLRQLVRSKSGDPEEFARLQQYNEDLQEERTHLQTHIAELEQLLRCSDNEKDKALTAMREQIEHAQRELASRDSLVRSLSEESRVLQKQLMDVAQHCQELARKLNERGADTENIRRETLQKSARERADPSVQAEIKSLREKLKEVTDMNFRWQQFNAQREDTVAKMTSEIQILQQKVNDAEQTRGHMAHETQVEMNRILDESRRVSRSLEDQKKTLTRVSGERDRHKRDLDNALGQIRALKEEIQKYRNSGASKGTATPAGDTTEIINALKAQIQICTEDFESERRDRERAHAKVSRLEAEIDQYKKEIDSLRRTIQQLQTMQFQQPDPGYDYPGNQHYSNERLAARGVHQPSARNLDKYNVIDSPKNSNNDVMDANVTEQMDRNERVVITADNHRTTDDKYVSLNASSISSYSNDSDNSKEQMSPVQNNNRKRHSNPNTPNEFSPRNSPPMKTEESEHLQCPKCSQAFSQTQLIEHMESCLD